MSIKHFELHRRWLEGREGDMAQRYTAEAQDHLLHGSALGESNEDVEAYREMAEEAGVEIKTRAPKREYKSAIKVAKRYPDSGVFDWKSHDLAEAVESEDFMAPVAKAELQRRTQNRVAKAKGRPPIPPTGKARMRPVEIAKVQQMPPIKAGTPIKPGAKKRATRDRRDFKEHEVKRDEKGQFSTTERRGAPKPDTKGGDNKTWEDHLNELNEVFEDKSATQKIREKIHQITDRGFNITETGVVNNSLSGTGFGLQFEKDGVEVRGWISADGTFNSLRLNGTFVQEVYKPSVETVLDQVEEAAVAPDGSVFLPKEDIRGSGISAYKQASEGHLAPTFFAPDKHEAQEMMEDHWDGEDWGKDTSFGDGDVYGPLKSRLYKAYSDNFNGLYEMSAGDLETLAQRSQYSYLFTQIAGARSLDGEIGDMSAAVKELKGSKQVRDQLASIVEEVESAVERAVAKPFEIPDYQRSHMLQRFEDQEVGETKYFGLETLGNLGYTKTDTGVFLNYTPSQQSSIGSFSVSGESLGEALNEFEDRMTLSQIATRLSKEGDFYSARKSAEHLENLNNYNAQEIEREIGRIKENVDSGAAKPEVVIQTFDRLAQDIDRMNRAAKRIVSSLDDVDRMHEPLGLPNDFDDDFRMGVAADLNRIEKYADSIGGAQAYLDARVSGELRTGLVTPEIQSIKNRQKRVAIKQLGELSTSEEREDYLEQLDEALVNEFSPDNIIKHALNGDKLIIGYAIGTLEAREEGDILVTVRKYENTDGEIDDALNSRYDDNTNHVGEKHFGLSVGERDQSTNRSAFKARIQFELSDTLLEMAESDVDLSYEIHEMRNDFVQEALSYFQSSTGYGIAKAEMALRSHELTIDDWVKMGGEEGDFENFHNAFERATGVEPEYWLHITESMQDHGEAGADVLEFYLDIGWEQKAKGVARNRYKELALNIHAHNNFSVPAGDGRLKEDFVREELLSNVKKMAAAKWADKVVHTWSQSAADREPLSLAVQYMVAQEFGGLEGDHGMGVLLHDFAESIARDRHIADKTVEVFEEKKTLLRATMHAMYQNTQRQLEEEGIDEVILYRGMKFDLDEPPAWATGHQLLENEAFKQASRDHNLAANLHLNPLSSWSTEWEQAHSFSQQHGMAGAVLASRIPRERIFGTARTGFGCLSEDEFVIKGGWNDPIEGGLQWQGIG